MQRNEHMLGDQRTEPEYYALTSNLALRGNIALQELQRDIARGVKQLSDSSYCESYGSTNTSLFFLNKLQSILGTHSLQAKFATLEVTKQGNSRLRVQTFSGFELIFTGVAGGYFGEGSRGCRDILKAVGFSENQYNKPFTDETFKVFKRAKKNV